jgi:hypothetical protein
MVCEGKSKEEINTNKEQGTQTETINTLTRRNTLKSGLAASATLLGAAGAGLAADTNGFNTATQSSTGWQPKRPVTTRRQVTSWELDADLLAYEQADTQLHYLGTRPRKEHSSESQIWAHQFVLNTLAIQTVETNDGSIQFNHGPAGGYEHKISINANDANKIDINQDRAGFYPSRKLESELMSLDDEITSSIPDLVHKSADPWSELESYATEAKNTSDRLVPAKGSGDLLLWVFGAGLGPLIQSETVGFLVDQTLELGPEIVDNLTGGSGNSAMQYSISDAVANPYAAYGSIIEFEILADPFAAPSLTIESKYSTNPSKTHTLDLDMGGAPQGGVDNRESVQFRSYTDPSKRAEQRRTRCFFRHTDSKRRDLHGNPTLR